MNEAGVIPGDIANVSVIDKAWMVREGIINISVVCNEINNYEAP